MAEKVSLIITAFNEEAQIKEKIQNSLDQDYPKGKLEIIVASDSSTDSTDEIVRSFAESGVRLVRTNERNGKEHAQKSAVEVATGDILVFSDTSTRLDRNGIQNLARNFNDPTIGCVSSVDIFIDKDGKVSGEGMYVKYEMILRQLESTVNSLVGLSGSLFAAKKVVCANFSSTMQSDFFTLLRSIDMGYRGVSDPESKGYYKNIKNEKKELDRKIRTVVRGLTVFFNNLYLLNPFKYKFFSFQLISHKLLRWVVPFLMVACFVSNVFILNLSPIYIVLFVLQVVFYSLAFVGHLDKWESGIYKIPLFFTMVNYSILVAWLRFLSGERITMWDVSKR